MDLQNLMHSSQEKSQDVANISQAQEINSMEQGKDLTLEKLPCFMPEGTEDVTHHKKTLH